ncbi:MAG: SDR family NAD(P)-dependent oxidoreductase [Gemmataceae bacterium]|nr:SDR family NAD(P)-dependent oxidoreductase [Gemmataceae bacterium]MDW8265569.1 SDR family NAD(P)-dependent oxidoreductase [Gemmataceae bacterium]
MRRDLRNKRMLITGASSGIGRALAIEAARRGARLILAARSTDALDETGRAAADEGAEVLTVPSDVTLEADRRRLLAATRDRFGGLDILVNNAGIGTNGHFADSSEDILRKVMEVNFFAPAELIRESIPMLREGVQPAIVNVGSMCGRRGIPAWSEYSASKFALCGLTEALRGEMVRFGIDVLLINPGLTRTALGDRLLRRDARMVIDFERGMPPEKLARKMLRAIEKNRTETVIGVEAWWLLLAHQLSPWLVDQVLIRVVRRLYAQPASS